MFFLEVKYAFSFKMRYRIVLYIYQNTWISFFIFVGRYPFSDSSIVKGRITANAVADIYVIRELSI